MVRRFAVLSLVALAGCSGLKDALTAHQHFVARAAGQELTVTQLAQLIAPVKQVPLSRATVNQIAELWVDYQLLGEAVANGDSLLDSATVVAANWPTVMQIVINRFHDQAIVQRAQVTDAEVDSAYNTGNVRWLDHILVRVALDTTAQVKAARRRIAEQYLNELKHGANFAKLAEKVSDDPGSAKNGGALGLVSRGQMVSQFEDAAWGLAPGQLSGVVQTAFGYHIIWRPALAQVRDSFATALKGLLVQRMDSIFMDSLTSHGDIKVKSSAAGAVRAAVADLDNAKSSGRVLATYRGGRFTMRDFTRWLEAFGPQAPGALSSAPDSTVDRFIHNLVRNELMVAAAHAAHVALTAGELDTLRTGFAQELDTLEAVLDITPDSLTAATAGATTRGAAGRAQAAANRVSAYFTGLISNPTAHRFYPLSPYLADVLRQRESWTISPVGVDAALDQATKLRGPEAPPNVPMMTPAPGGPPLSRPQTTPPTRHIE